MRNGFLGTFAGLALSAGLALGQAPAIAPPEGPAAGMEIVNPPGPASYLDGIDCAVPCAVPKGPCGPPGRIWLTAEYLFWWQKNSSVPPLVTTGPLATGGALVPGTTTLLSGPVGDSGVHSGGRFGAWVWLNDCQTKGIMADYFFLGPQSTNATFSGSGAPGSPLIARPFFDVTTGLPNAEIVAVPGVESGTINVNTNSRLQGAQINGVCNLCCCCDYRVDLLAGFRWLNLEESLTIAENTTILTPLLNPATGAVRFPAGTQITVVDEVHTNNNFYGGQVGTFAEYRRGRAFVDFWGLIALGTTHEEVDIHGTTAITPPGGPTTVTSAGLLALPTNSGHFSRDVFAVAPEVRLNLGYQVTQNLRVFGGYTFLYLSNVVRPGDQLDLNVNPRQVPTALNPALTGGPARPTFTFHDTDFWAQGLNAGIWLLF